MTKGSIPQRDQLIAAGLDAELFHDDEDCFASIWVRDHRETHRLRSKVFVSWLAGNYYRRHGTAPGTEACQEAIRVLESFARQDGENEKVHLRVAGDDTAIYVDLGTADWTVVCVTGGGWHLMPGHHSPLKFVRSRGSRPLPVPELGGTLEALTGFVNVHTDDVPLVFGFLVAAMRPAGPHPILALISQQGSGKSTLARILKALVDPNAAPIRAAPREERDLHVAARNSWMLAFDNLSSLPPWLADGMASLSTGAGYAARELRSDVDEVVFECKRPQILNSISDIASRPDLASRAVNIEMLPINGAKRRAESEFWADFERKRPRILGGLLSAVAGALRSLDSVEIVDKPRMADFACWSVAAEPWLPIKRGDFLRSYRANLKAMTDTSIENDRFIREVLRLVREIKKWRGSAADLLDAIKARLADKDSAKAKGFPKTGQWTSVKLRRFAVALADVGVTVDFGRETEKRFIELKLRQ